MRLVLSRELLSSLAYGVNGSSGFPADRSLIESVDKLGSIRISQRVGDHEIGD